jgi:hypothetical protein
LEKRGFIMKQFNQRTAEFHRILFNNQILFNRLQSRRQETENICAITSFARGKGIGAKSEDLKNFLFANDDDQNKEYEKRKKEIEEAHEEYKRRARVYETVKMKKDRFFHCLKTKRNVTLQRIVRCCSKLHGLIISVK